MNESRKAVLHLLQRYRGLKVIEIKDDGSEFHIRFRCRYKRSVARLASVSVVGAMLGIMPEKTLTKVDYVLYIPESGRTDEVAAMLALGLKEQPDVDKDYVLRN